MRDDLMGGLLATAIATPVLIACCGGGGVLLATFVGAIGGWMSGFGGIAVLVAAATSALVWRDLRRRRQAGSRCAPQPEVEGAQHG